MVSLFGMAIMILTFFLLEKQIKQYPYLFLIIFSVYILLLATVLSPLDHYLVVTRKPILKKIGKVVGKNIFGKSYESKKYSVKICLQDGKKIRLGLSEKQFYLLKENDIAVIVYQGALMRSFQRVTDKNPIVNEHHFPSDRQKNKRK